jgi:hypothetical protein
MDYGDIESIAAMEGWTNRQKIDELLRIDSYIRTDLGIDSTKKEIDEAKRKSARIIREIKKIDPEEGKLFTNYPD